eukprot:CAMPEP_0118639664 /NCGR_PEP_ID=MMETSP0785-20121206/4341_1 /TAXON_ID=91992 /ORGANISM="Bolidomonas pacifica, Strain CCMP 1866" /LENGTH=83 /DNA_ID=CAMNT_0006531001 /DNA_START=18 /DNA_END=266 /DNA_ORIENTATION=-
MVDGHVGLVLGGAATYFATINATMPKGWVRTFIHREPMVAGGIALAGIGMLMPLTIVPIRRALGFPTDNYDGAKGKKAPVPWW